MRHKRKKIKLGLSNVSFLVDDVVTMKLEKCDLIVACYTMQFIRPSVRQTAFNKMFESLNWGSALILFEKSSKP